MNTINLSNPSKPPEYKCQRCGADTGGPAVVKFCHQCVLWLVERQKKRAKAILSHIKGPKKTR